MTESLREVRARIAEMAEYHIFISVSNEECEGPVVAVKDLIDVRGMVTTGGGIILPHEPATHDAPVVSRIRKAGCCIIGKTNTHEWAFGITNENPHYGAVHNPRDPSRMSGGSSGGSAAAVAAGLCDWAIGTDTGGSIRIPASLCGVVGFKPTVGTVSTEGVIPLSWTFDTVGPLAPNVPAAARALEMMTGRSSLVPEGSPARSEFRVAVPAGWVDEMDTETRAVWERVSADLPEIPFPDRAELTSLYQPVFSVDAATYHEEWMERYPQKYGQDVLQNLRGAREVSGVQYLRALRRQDAVRADVEAAMSDWDAILVPATARVAPLLGTPNVREPLLHYTRPFNFTGQPVITVPGPATGLPVGIQVVGHFGADAELTRVARAFELAWGGIAV
jgi:aspartyl-tRNA(Asn)/glutamyl-tRNA(Gln) amidotransferase subunit A